MIIFYVLAFFLKMVSADDNCPIHYQCNDTLYNPSYVERFCNKNRGSMKDRCCNVDHTIVGVDLRYCNIKELNISDQKFVQTEILDLRRNEFDKFSAEDLIGFMNLTYLYLPWHIPCPGGQKAWNMTKESNFTQCIGQLDPCITLNITCGKHDNANCCHLGPGSAKCICSPGHFGYKCMNEGTFPTVNFSCAVIFPTIFLSIALWFIQGRDPYRKSQTPNSY